MEKYLIALLLVVAVVLSGCVSDKTNAEDIINQVKEDVEATVEDHLPTETEGTAEEQAREQESAPFVTFDFDSEVSGDCWEYVGEPTGERGVTGDAHSGSGSLFLINTEKNTTHWQTTGPCLQDVQVGKTYELRGWVKVDKEGAFGANGKAKITIDSSTRMEKLLNRKALIAYL